MKIALPGDNLSPEPTRRFVVSPASILEAQRHARAQELAVVGYYHSHPGGSGRPSDLDRRDAWPDTSYVILGLDGTEVASARSWRLDGSVFVEEVVVTDSDP